MESVLQYAKARKYREGENPANLENFEYTLPKKSDVHKVKHHPALPYAEIGAFMADLRKDKSMAARVVEFAILTATRSQEARLATWEEIDMSARVWTIPAERMKAGKEHRVPLSDDVMKFLNALPRYEENNLLFPSPKGGTMSGMSLRNALQRIGHGDITVHGFRSTFRDWAGETTSYPREVCEHALAHQLKDKTEASYQHGDFLAKRAHMMNDWARHCGTIPSAKGENVIPIRKAV